MSLNFFIFSFHRFNFNSDCSGIDDPIGALSVHLVGGIWGHLSVGLFAQDPAPLTSTLGRSGLLMGKKIIFFH